MLQRRASWNRRCILAPTPVFVGLIAVLTHAQDLEAAEIFVDASANCAIADGSPARPFCSVQEGVDAAAAGDTVVVAPGTYPESVRIIRSLVLRSSGDPALTILDGQGQWRPLTVEDGEVRVQGFTFTGGFDLTAGGAAFVDGRAELELQQCTLRDSSAAQGGGVAAFGNLFVERCRFENNRATEGGALAATGNTVAVVDSAFEANRATSHGGACFFRLGQYSLDFCRFVGNESGAEGGAVHDAPDAQDHAPSFIDRCEFHANSAQSGGALSLRARASLRGSLVVDNVATARAGGLFVDGDFQNVLCSSCTIAGNQAPRDGGLVNLTALPLSLAGCILAGNRAQIGADGSGRVQSSGYNLVGDSRSLNWVDPSGTDLLDVDPGFVDPTQGDYSLMAGSNAVDSGSPFRVLVGWDIRGLPRTLDGNLDRIAITDRGALEYGNVTLRITGTPRPGSVLSVESEGRAGLPVFLFIGEQLGLESLPPYGPLYVAPPFRLLPFAVLPDRRDFTLGPNVPVGLQIVVQELAVDSASRAGNFSNRVSLTIEQ